jgi:hypothetical protein
MTLDDIKRLASSLRLPMFLVTSERVQVSRVEGLALVLHRFAWPCRLNDMAAIYGRSGPAVSMIVTHVVHVIYDAFKDKINLDLERIAPLLPVFSEAISNAGAPLTNCWGFIDGTARPICRPTVDQRLFYSGHKRQHCVKYQSVTTPDGIISHMFGPVAGRHHDLFVLLQSQLANILSGDDRFTNYIIYGDPGYTYSSILCCPFKGSALSPEQLEFNKAMSSVRVSVEWSFGIITNLFQHLDWKRGQRLLLSPVCEQYLVATLLTNCVTCLRGQNEVSLKFKLQPPTLDAYLG